MSSDCHAADIPSTPPAINSARVLNSENRALNPRYGTAGATIYLNGKIQQNPEKLYAQNKGIITTPAKIKIFYRETICGSGASRLLVSGKKRLTVNSDNSTFAEDISLFKKKYPAIAHERPL